MMGLYITCSTALVATRPQQGALLWGLDQRGCPEAGAYSPPLLSST